MKVLRIVPNFSSTTFGASRDFYMEVFDMVVSVELDSWYMQLMAPERRSLNMGFIEPAHELFAGRTAQPGDPFVLTFEVDDVDEAYERALRIGAEIPMSIRDEYGQRHFTVVDPNGVLLNVMSALAGPDAGDT